MNANILIVEDEEAILNFLQDILQEQGYSVKTANNGMDGITMFRKENIDLVLLDIMLPKIDGYVVLEMIRQESDVPVIMMTALDDEKHELKGFDLRADDYITKPFSMKIVIKRIEAALRKFSKTQGHAIRYKELIMDMTAHTVLFRGNPVAFTQTEFELLKTLLQHQNQVYTRDELLNIIWGYDYYGSSRVINTHIGNIRKKLGADYIVSVRGVGYKIVEENSK